MTVQVQHRRSSDASKRPNAINLLAGELALNFNNGTSGIFYEDSNGAVVKAGPAEVGATAPNSSPATGGSSGNSVGEFWYDTSTNLLKVYNGTSFAVAGATTVGSTSINLGGTSTTLAGLTDVSSAKLTLPGSSSGNVSLQAAAASDNTSYSWPAADGTANYVLSTNGNGVLSWAEARTNDVFDDTTGIAVNGTADTITFTVDDTDYYVMNADGDFLPQTGTQDLGATSSRFQTIYTTNLNATNITGEWSGDIVTSALGGTGLDNEAATDGQILIASSNGVGASTFSAGTVVAGQSLSSTLGAGTLQFDVALAAAAGTSGAGNAGAASFKNTQFSVDANGYVSLDLVAVLDGGTGLDGSSAGNGTLLIGNGTGYTLTTLTAGEGLDVTNASGSITLSAEDATAGSGTGNKGVASFEDTDFTATSGHITLATTVLQSASADSGSAAPVASVLTIAGGTGITTSGTGSTVTATLDDTDVTASGYGAANTVGTFTVDGQGRLTAAADVSINILHTQVSDFDTGVRTNRLDQMAAPTAAVAMNGQLLSGLADPSGEQDAATKKYVDSTAQGLDTKASVKAASTANLAATYANGTAGDGATLTNSGAQAAFSLDGDAIASGGRVLIKDQTAAAQNGIYEVTTVGSASSNWVLTRTADMDSASEIPSAYCFVEGGDTNESNGYTCTAESPVTVGTTALPWEQFSGAGQIDPGDGLVKDGNILDVVGTADRIVANANSVDIASTYVGQASITTLGTISTGAWNGTLVGTLYGGTGADGSSVTARHALMAPTGSTGNVSYREILTGDIAPTTGGSFDGGSF